MPFVSKLCHFWARYISFFKVQPNILINVCQMLWSWKLTVIPSFIFKSYLFLFFLSALSVEKKENKRVMKPWKSYQDSFNILQRINMILLGAQEMDCMFIFIYLFTYSCLVRKLVLYRVCLIYMFISRVKM